MTDLDDAYANMAHIPEGARFPRRWAQAAAEFAATHPPEIRDSGLLWRNGGVRGLVIFLHGGYWLKFAPEDFAHLAAGALAAGCTVAMPRYTLAPKARIAEITREVAARITDLAVQIPGPIRLCGHSAGGHLAARMLCPGVLSEAVRARLAKVVPISPLSDLAPLMRTSMNADLRLDAAEAEAESPVHCSPPHLPVEVWVGADERPAFLDQARALAMAWHCPLTAEPGRHHFDVIEGLETPEHPLMQALLG